MESRKSSIHGKSSIEVLFSRPTVGGNQTLVGGLEPWTFI